MNLDENLRKVREIVSLASALLNLSEEDFQILHERSNILQKWSDRIVETFYETHLRNPDARRLVENLPREEFEKTLREWYLSLLRGKPDDRFWLMQWIVALEYLAKGVQNAQMASLLQMGIVQLEFGRLCFEKFDRQTAWRIFEAFKRITTAINALVVEGYRTFYIRALENMTGIKPQLLERMVLLESRRMWEEYRNKYLKREE